jgi:DNA-binding LacI/PurR family transcriptional regulator
MARPATLADIARAANVHPTTVSRVLRRSPNLNVRDETRARVEQIAADLGYRPNAIARGLRTSSTGAIGLILPSLRNPAYAHILRGAFRRAWERDFVVVLAEDGGGEQAARAYERLVEEGRIDGLLVASARPDSPFFEHAGSGAVPIVFVNRRSAGAGQSVSMREEDAGRLAAAHLLSLGHLELAHLAGPADVDTAQRRASGFTAAASEAGARVEVVHAAFDEPGGFAAMQTLLRAPGIPTAVFVSNINQTVGALAAVKANGSRVPEDLSLVSYDDDPIGAYLEPPITAIGMPLAALGAAAVDCMLTRLQDGTCEDVMLEAEPRLVLRASTAQPRSNR